MEFPNREQAYVPREKLTKYLLSESHPAGGSKAIFFRGCGFTEDYVDLLEEALLAIAHKGPLDEVEETPYGVKYALEGMLESPLGRRVCVRTVWIIPSGKTAPRFITAYPA